MLTSVCFSQILTGFVCGRARAAINACASKFAPSGRTERGAAREGDQAAEGDMGGNAAE